MKTFFTDSIPQIIATIFCCVNSYFLTAQNGNLVINPSFESSTTPPIKTWIPWMHAGDTIVPGWTTPNGMSSDYFNSDISSCDGVPIVLARTGQGRCGLIFGREDYSSGEDDNYREYVQGSFSHPLVAGKKYSVKFYVALDRSSNKTVKDVGCFITKDPGRPHALVLDPQLDTNKLKAAQCPWCPQDMMLDFLANPQIVDDEYISASDGWVKISGIYTATGGEKYITIGNFSHSKYKSIAAYNDTVRSSDHIRRSAYFWLDDVSVTLYDSTAYKNTMEDPGDYYLFLLDVSGSMKFSDHLELMKNEIKKFADSLNPDNNIGLLAFSDHCNLLLPFTPATDSRRIDTMIGKLVAGGVTDGDLAIRTVSWFLDSLQLQSRCHIIMATDGIFEIKTTTMELADSLLGKDSADLCVLQFGNKRNVDLRKISQSVPGSKYVSVHHEKNIAAILDKQLPPSNAADRPRRDPDAVYYTSTLELLYENMRACPQCYPNTSRRTWWKIYHE
ncbi:MAG: VWA domain-containing protein [Bacteroidetes bacterium]|nr:VWA domain-containing protein [Bacteroidota bacterium]